MNLFQWYIFSRSKNLFNTVVGGLGTTYTSKSLFASFIGIPESSIFYYQVVGADILCYINQNYVIPTGAFTNNTAITSYIDLEQKVTSINGSNTASAAFKGSSVKVGDFRGVTQFNNFSFYASDVEKIICNDDVTYIGYVSFVYCLNFTGFFNEKNEVVDFINLSNFTTDAFGYSAIKHFKANSPNCTTGFYSLFYHAEQLESVELNYADNIAKRMFGYTYMLERLELPEVLTAPDGVNTNDSPIVHSGIKEFICNKLLHLPKWFFLQNPNLERIELRGLVSIDAESTYSGTNLGNNVPIGVTKKIIVPQTIIDNNAAALSLYTSKGYILEAA